MMTQPKVIWEDTPHEPPIQLLATTFLVKMLLASVGLLSIIGGFVLLAMWSGGWGTLCMMGGELLIIFGILTIFLLLWYDRQMKESNK